MNKTLISSFKSVSDKNPIMVTLLVVYRWIICKWNDVYKFTVLSRDARADGDLETAKRLKAKTGAVTPAGVFEGGHQIANITSLTQICLADCDHINREMMPIIINKVKTDSHTVLEYVTNSEEGIRIFYHWVATDENGGVIPSTFFVWDRKNESHDDFLVRVLPYHAAAYDAGNAYYAELLGIPYDSQTKDASRLSFLAHDPNAFLQLDAEPFTISAEEATKHSDTLKKAMSSCGLPSEHEQQHRTNHCDCGADNVFDLIEHWVENGTSYTPGTFNKYVYMCGYLCCEFGIDEDAAIFWATSRFSDYNSRQVKSIIHSCYRKANFGIYQFNKHNHHDRN